MVGVGTSAFLCLVCVAVSPRLFCCPLFVSPNNCCYHDKHRSFCFCMAILSLSPMSVCERTREQCRDRFVQLAFVAFTRK